MGYADLRSGQKLWLNWYLIPVVNFSLVRRAQLAKSVLLFSPPRWGPWDLFRPFKICSDTKERVGAEINGKLLHLGSWFFGGRPAFGQNCSLGSWVFSERPAFGQNTLMIMMMISTKYIIKFPLLWFASISIIFGHFWPQALIYLIQWKQTGYSYQR